MTLYLLRGLPGSGKSTLADELLACDLAQVKCEADSFFMKKGFYDWDPTKLPEAHAECYACAELALLCGKSVVVSNTSLTEREVDRYKTLAESVGVKFVSILVETRHNNPNVHMIPTNKLASMRAKLSVKA
jgi:predicted kinase